MVSFFLSVSTFNCHHTFKHITKNLFMKKALLFISVLLCIVKSNAQPGTVDGSFSGAEIYVVRNAMGASVAVQSDGKVLTLAILFEFSGRLVLSSLQRYNINGTLDVSFGNGGSAQGIPGLAITANDFVIDKNGKIVIAGYRTVSIFDRSTDLSVARYNSDGTPDITFGSGGAVVQDFGSTTDRFLNAAVQDDGKIIAVGAAGMFRYNNNGTPDNSFGTAGIVTSGITRDVVLQPDGKILGFRGANLVRYNSDGALDATFGTNGIIANVNGTQIALQQDNTIVVVSSSQLLRYLPNGQPDPSFGTGGAVGLANLTPQTEVFHSVAIQPDGKIIIGGGTVGVSDPAVFRFETNGMPDLLFGNNGRAITLLNSFPSNEQVNDIAIGGYRVYTISDEFYADGSGLPDAKLVAYNIITLPVGGEACPRDTIITLASCSATANVLWPVPADYFPATISIPAGFYPDGRPYDGEGSLTLLGTFGVHGYYRSSDAYQSYSWTQANQIATSVRGHLTTITSEAENDFILSRVQSIGYFSWLGLRRGPTQFFWITSESLSYTNWGPEDPNNGGSTTTIAEPYVFMYEGSGKWHDLIDFRLPFQVEYEKAPIRWSQISGPTNASSLGVGVYPVCYERLNIITNKKDTCCFTVTVQCNASTTTVAALDKQTSERAVDFSVKALPNPFSSSFTLQLNNNNSKERISVRVMDISGRLVEARDGVASNTVIELGTTYRPGTYLVQVQQGTKRTTLKLVKQTR
jgi:uncharacterized delta-60 repeat protein